MRLLTPIWGISDLSMKGLFAIEAYLTRSFTTQHNSEFDS